MINMEDIIQLKIYLRKLNNNFKNVYKSMKIFAKIIILIGKQPKLITILIISIFFKTNKIAMMKQKKLNYLFLDFKMTLI